MKNKDLELDEGLKESLNQNGFFGGNIPKKKVYILIAAIIVTVLAAIYAAGLQYYTTHFLPGTYINGINYSNVYREAIWTYLDGVKPQVEVDVEGAGDSHLTFAIEEIADEYIFADESVLPDSGTDNIGLWPLQSLGRRDITAEVKLDITEEEIKDYLDKVYGAMELVEPQDAYIDAYDKRKNGFVIVEELYGNKPNTKKVAEIIHKQLESMDTTLKDTIKVDLIAEEAIEKPALIAEDNTLVELVEAANRYLKSDITYNWNGSEVHIPKEEIASWVEFDANEAKLNQKAVKEYLNKLAEEYDTYEKAGSFTTADGRVKSIQRKLFGFKADVDKEAARLTEQIEKGASATLDVYTKSKGYVIGTKDWGSSYVEVDMSAQMLYLWIDGNQVLSTPVVTGNMATNCNSPEGIFGVKYKKSETILRGATWNDFVYYWMPYWNSYGMHDATWRDQFGGNIYQTSGSHGCVNIPLEAAGVIYNTVDTGFPVICYY